MLVASHRFEVRDASFYILFTAGEHRVDEAGELMSGGFDGPGLVQSSQARTVGSADERVAGARGGGGDPQRLPETIDDLGCAPR